jgi:hypothetical protein
MKTNAPFEPAHKPENKQELLATIRWRTGSRSRMDPPTEFDLLGTADEIGKEVGRRLGLRNYKGDRYKGKIEIEWRIAPTEENQ